MGTGNKGESKPKKIISPSPNPCFLDNIYGRNISTKPMIPLHKVVHSTPIQDVETKESNSTNESNPLYSIPAIQSWIAVYPVIFDTAFCTIDSHCKELTEMVQETGTQTKIKTIKNKPQNQLTEMLCLRISSTEKRRSMANNTALATIIHLHNLSFQNFSIGFFFSRNGIFHG